MGFQKGFQRPKDETWIQGAWGLKFGRNKQGIRIYIFRSKENGGDVALLIDDTLTVRTLCEGKTLDSERTV